MAFTVVHQSHHQTLWAPVEVSETVYVGSIIGMDTATPLSGVQPMPVAAGAANVTNLDVPLGVVVGTNNTGPNKVYSSSYGGAEYITAGNEASAHDSTTQFQGVEGPLREDYAMVEYIPITAETVIRGSIYNAAYGTAPTAVAVTTGSGTDGLDMTTAASDVATVANFATAYCRTGNNMGRYRILTTASSTTHEFTPALKADVAVGDTFVIINGLRPFGMSYAYIDAEGTYIDCSAALTANYLMIDVVRLDLSTAGEEYVEFRFSPVNFQHTVRLNTTA
jgi:hypothetical protein